MNSTIKLILLIIGIILAGYGIFMIIQPETDISIGDVDLLQVQDNTNAYITIALGIIAIATSLFIKKR